MGNWKFYTYHKDLAPIWDKFVKESRNGSFLFLRDYMDYHADRFNDFSLLAYKDDRLLSILPANITNSNNLKILHSHQGLTYGGWLLPVKHFNANDMIELFGDWIKFCQQNDICKIDYKPLPHIYAKSPSDEDLYALYKYGACQINCNLSETILLEHNIGFNTQQKRNLKKALNIPCLSISEIFENDEIDNFYTLLTTCLQERHTATPVHSLEELKLLKHRFNTYIRIFVCRNKNNEMQAGICIYETADVAHCQYIASTEEARRTGQLTLLFSTLIDYYTNCKTTDITIDNNRETINNIRYFDFGTSNDNTETGLNQGLIRQKSSLGGTAVIYPRYEITIP